MAESDGGSQTLARGLRALEVIGTWDSPRGVVDLAERLEIHRSMAYRLVKTLEQFGFVERLASGGLVLGTKMATLARGVAKDLQTAAAPELTALAEELEMTAFLVVYDGESAVTLSSAEPQNVETTLGKKPGSRHAIGQGAPGKVIRSVLDPAGYPVRDYEISQNEVIPGIASIAVPLGLSGGQPAALAVLYLPHDVDTDRVVRLLQASARRIAAAAGS